MDVPLFVGRCGRVVDCVCDVSLWSSLSVPHNPEEFLLCAGATLLRRERKLEFARDTYGFGHRATMQVGKSKVHKSEIAQRWATQREFPVRWARIGDRSYYQFQGKFYWDNDDLTPNQVHALLVTRQQAQQRRVERAEAIVAMGQQPRNNVRGHVPDNVKQYVWTRDGGQCRHCGATVELQYDHVIPIAMGGSSEPENLQILCGPCNRRKSSGLTVGSTQTTLDPQPRPAQIAPAGWYPNPDSGASGSRYWDGTAWTEHVHD